MKQFENMTIKELRELHDQFRNQNPEVQTADDMLNETREEPTP